MFRKILFPIDFNETSLSVLPFVINMAQKFQAKVHLLYVVENLHDHIGWATPHPSISTYSSGLEKAAGKKMKDFYDEHFEKLQGVERHVIMGDPGDDVVRFAREREMDLIVMATHGRKGLDRVIFGSVAENVARNSHIPVLLVNPHRLDKAAYGILLEEG